MLVLTRKESEMVQIGDGIIVKVIQTGRGSIKLGIDAPPHVRVLRGEMSAELAALPPGDCRLNRDKPTPRTSQRDVAHHEAV